MDGCVGRLLGIIDQHDVKDHRFVFAFDSVGQHDAIAVGFQPSCGPFLVRHAAENHPADRGHGD